MSSPSIRLTLALSLVVVSSLSLLAGWLLTRLPPVAAGCVVLGVLAGAGLAGWKQRSLGRLFRTRKLGSFLGRDSALPCDVVTLLDRVLGQALGGTLVLDVDGRIASASGAAGELLGYTPGELVGRGILEVLEEPEDVVSLAGPRKNAGFGSWQAVYGKRKDGGTSDLGAFVVQEIGAWSGRVILLRDQGERKQAERRLAAETAVTRVLARQAPFDEAVPGILEAIASNLGWEVGGYWTPDAAGVLHPADAWTRHPDQVKPFLEAAEDISSQAGDLPSRAAAARELVCVADLAADPKFFRAEQARAAGLRSGLAFPLSVDGEVVGVFEFYTRRLLCPIPEASDPLFTLLNRLSRQFAQLVERQRAEENQRRASQEVEDLYNRAPCGYHSLDARGRIVRINDTALAWLGHSRQELLGRPFRELIALPDRKEFDTHLALAQTGGLAQDREFRLARKDGSILYGLFSTAGLSCEPEGSATRSSRSTWVDVTRRHHDEEQLAELNARLQALLDSATDVSIISTDPTGIIRTFNTGAEKLLGYTAREVVNLHTPELIHMAAEIVERGRELSAELGREVSGFEVFVARARQGRAEQREWTYVRKDGQHRTVNLVVSAVRGPGNVVSGFLGIALDVTEQHRAAEELKAAKDAAEAANSAKTSFLASISHEIRTPLNGILGMTELLARTQTSPEQANYLGSLNKAANALLGLITDVLDVSKIEAGKLELEKIPFDVREVVGDTMRVVESQANFKDVRLEVSLDPNLAPAFLGDPGRLRQVLLNLVGNAVKFTDRGEVTLKVEVVGQEKNGSSGCSRLRFLVRDTGVGIPQDLQARIFEPFAQGDLSTARTRGGTGLGLTIASRLVERMGGQLMVASEVGRGSTFSFTLDLEKADRSQALSRGRLPSRDEPNLPGTPVRPAENQRVEKIDASERLRPRAGSPAPSRRLRVLVAEDNVINQEVLTVWLQNQGHEVVVVPTGGEALELTGKEPFDIVLMDVQMPEMDGVRATRLIRSRESSQGTGRLPIVAVTANAMQGERQRCLSAGMDEYLSKPVRLDDLQAVIARLTGTASVSVPSAPAAGWMEGLARMGLERPAVVRLVRTLLETLPPRLQTLRRAVNNRDATLLETTAHTLKGSLLIFNAREAAALAQQLELLGRAGQVQEVGERLNDLEAALGRLTAELEAYAREG